MLFLLFSGPTQTTGALSFGFRFDEGATRGSLQGVGDVEERKQSGGW